MCESEEREHMHTTEVIYAGEVVLKPAGAFR